jgi:hypothetical protein
MKNECIYTCTPAYAFITRKETAFPFAWLLKAVRQIISRKIRPATFLRVSAFLHPTTISYTSVYVYVSQEASFLQVPKRNLTGKKKCAIYTKEQNPTTKQRPKDWVKYIFINIAIQVFYNITLSLSLSIYIYTHTHTYRYIYSLLTLQILLSMTFYIITHVILYYIHILHFTS